MGRHAKAETIKVIDTLYIKQTKSSLYYQLYFTHNGKSVRASTKKETVDAAKKFALEYYVDYKRGGSEFQRSISFKKLVDAYLESIIRDGKFDYHSATIKRHFLPFFAKRNDISTISTADIQLYVQHRKAKSNPTPQTLNRENTVLRQMLAYALRAGWLKTVVTIDNYSEKNTRNRRPHFTVEEYRQLYKAARRRIAEAYAAQRQAGERNSKLFTTTIWSRQLLNDVVLLMANTGLRVDELKTITWRNVDWDNGYIQLINAGKTRSDRRLHVRKTGMRALERIKERRVQWKLGKGSNGELDANELVIALPNATPINSFKKGFAELLAAAQIATPSRTTKHTLTSLRHTYATFRLQKGVKMRVLALQMGTSERMIQRHYGHDNVGDYEDELNS